MPRAIQRIPESAENDLAGRERAIEEDLFLRSMIEPSVRKAEAMRERYDTLGRDERLHLLDLERRNRRALRYVRRDALYAGIAEDVTKTEREWLERARTEAKAQPTKTVAELVSGVRTGLTRRPAMKARKKDQRRRKRWEAKVDAEIAAQPVPALPVRPPKLAIEASAPSLGELRLLDGAGEESGQAPERRVRPHRPRVTSTTSYIDDDDD